MIQKMIKDKKKMAERFLSHALGIIYLLTGEEYTIVKKDSPHSSIHKVSGEVPINCDDVAVYFSMEEWEYIEGHKEVYKDVMMENNHQRILGVPTHRVSESADLPDEDVETESPSKKGEDERGKKDIHQMENHTDPCSSDVNAENVSNVEQIVETKARRQAEVLEQEIQEQICTGFEEEKGDTVINIEEYPRNEKDIQLVESHLYLYGSNINTEIIPEPNMRIELDVEDHEIQENICIEPHQNVYTVPISDGGDFETDEKDIKQEDIYSDNWTGDQDIGIYGDYVWRPGRSANVNPPVVSITESEVDPYVVECLKIETDEIPITLSTNETMSKNTYGQYKSYGSIQSMAGDINEVKSHREANKFSRSTPRFTAKGLHLHGNRALSKPYTTTKKDSIQGHNMQLFTSKSGSRKGTRAQETQLNDKKRNYNKRGAHPHSYRSQLITPQSSGTEDRPYACYECGKSFVQRSQFIVHQRTHTGEKPYMCTECFKSFSQKSHLVRHQRFHTGEKPFECSVCWKRFSQKAHLVIHTRIHTGEKPFPCPDCGKCFISKSHLVTHQKIHPSEEPFLCSICNYSCRDGASLIKHQKSHIGQKIFNS